MLLYLQGAGLTGPATDAAGFSNIKNEDIAFFAQDSWKIRPNFTLNYGLRWEAQIFPDPVVPPSQTAYGIFLNDPRFPSDGTLPNPNETVSTTTRICVGHFEGRQISVARERGNLLRAAKHAVAGGLDHDERRAATDDLPEHADHFVRRAWSSLARRRRAAVERGALRRRRCNESVPVLQRRACVQSRLREPAHLHHERRLRAGDRDRLVALSRLSHTRKACT